MIVLSIDRLAEKPSNVLRNACNKYVRKNPMSMEVIAEVLFGKFDEAIEDMENGRVQFIEEVWKEIDSI